MDSKLEDVSGIGSATAERMRAAGIDSIQKLAEIDLKDLLKVKGVGKASASKYIKTAKRLLGNKEVKVEVEEVKLDQGQNRDSSKEIAQRPPKREPPQEDLIIESHSETVKFISKFIKSEYLTLEKEKDKYVIKDALQNPIESFKFFTKKELNFVKAILRVSDVYEILEYKDKNLFNYITTSQLKTLEKEGIKVKELESKIQKAITITSILDQLRDKSIKLKEPGEEQKIIVAGLDRAGKTAILTTFGGKLGIDELKNLRPTKKIDRQRISSESLSVYIWDFGGQTSYRKDYLKNPGAYFLDVDLFIYVIDVQDYERFEESFTYLKAILNALEQLQEHPYTLIFIHKYDPDLRKDPDIQLNVEFVKENLKEILLERDFPYEIYLTSIYSVISREPKFSKFIKEMVQQKDLVADPTIDKIEELSKIINKALVAVIKLSESVSTQYMEINQRFDALETKINSIESGAPLVSQPQEESRSVSSSSPPPPPPPPPDPLSTKPIPTPSNRARESGTSLRSSILDELKSLFAKTKEINR
ncbi:MAG: hypothetical protein EU548_07925 [Promethearchaeota archaeon]|nr:MAG: hypothetical protein EU548_07925 [Candidatus Lokiarchaeota archaeon]